MELRQARWWWPAKAPRGALALESRLAGGYLLALLLLPLLLLADFGHFETDAKLDRPERVCGELLERATGGKLERARFGNASQPKPIAGQTDEGRLKSSETGGYKLQGARNDIRFPCSKRLTTSQARKLLLRNIQL